VPHCGEDRRIEKAGSGLIDRDLGLHFPTEDLVAHLGQTIPGITWDMRNVTAAYQIYYRKRPCEIDVLACSNCHIRYANSQWKERSTSYQSDVARDGLNGLYGRASDATWVRRKAAWAGYACEVLGPIKGLEVLEVGSADGILAWQPASFGARMTGVEVNTNASNYARQVMGLEKIVTNPYAKDLFPEASFERIVSFHVIEHVPDFEAFIGAMAAHLRPGGKLLLQCPIVDANRHAVSSSHPLGLTAGLLARAFKQHGLVINSVERYRGQGGDVRLDPDINAHWSGISSGAISIIAERP
jgi:2-polyprenyl-3-methyl-5-hydroxy-6-metoxy-1,4-benzoquinol methylase